MIEKLFENNKGVLAIDERESSIVKKLEKFGVDGSKKDKYRELLLTTDDLNKYISCVILSEDTFNTHKIGEQRTVEYLRERGIMVNVKVDEGIVDGKTQGLNMLAEKLDRYKVEAQFTKWRATINIGEETDHMVEDMLKYAEIVLSYGVTPFLEPEVLINSANSIDEMRDTIKDIISKLNNGSVDLSKCILKTSFATTGSNDNPEEVGVATYKALEGNKFGGIVFLSGGLDEKASFEYLYATKKLVDYNMSFSFGRALQDRALSNWNEIDDEGFQKVFLETLRDKIR